MPLSLEPLPEGTGMKKMIKIMENFPIISPLRRTDKQFTLFSNQVQCETIIQQFDDICGYIVQDEDKDANIKNYNFTCKQIQADQLSKFNQMIKNCQIKAEKSQSSSGQLIQGDLIVQFGQLLQDMISVTQQSADALTKHFARQKHDILLSFNVDVQRIQWEIDNLQDVYERLQERNTKLEVMAEDKKKEIFLAMKRIQNMLPDCRNNINVLDIQQKISMSICCPVCDEQLNQSNLLYVMYPCGCGVCQKCFKQYNTKKNNNVCVGCGEIIEDHVIDGVVASRLQEIRLDFSEICHSLIRELTKIQQTSVEILQNTQ